MHIKEDEIKAYLLKNAFPIFVEGMFIVFVYIGILKMVYLNFILFLLLITYFVLKHEYSFVKWKEEVRNKTFWKAFFITLGLIIAGFIIMTMIQNCFPDIPLGDIRMKTDTPFELLLFAIQTILFPPLAEEMFYRKYLISLNGGAITAITLIFSSILFAVEHAVYPFGILTYMILGISFGIAYIRHQNIYAMMSAHFLVNLLGNGTMLVFMLI